MTLDPGEETRLPMIEPLPCRFWPAERVSVPSIRLLAERVAPAATAILVDPPIEPVPVSEIAPALMSVLPVQVFVPARVSVLEFFLVIVPRPEMALEAVISVV